MPELTGHCNCGGVRFEIDEPLTGAAYCHCTRCQRRTGAAASAQAGIPLGALRIVAGEDLIRAWRPEDGWPKEFCSVCGSQLFSVDPSQPGKRSVRLGVIDGDPGVRPRHRHHIATAAVWEPLPDDGLPRYPDTVPPGA